MHREVGIYQARDIFFEGDEFSLQLLLFLLHIDILPKNEILVAELTNKADLIDRVRDERSIRLPDDLLKYPDFIESRDTAGWELASPGSSSPEPLMPKRTIYLYFVFRILDNDRQSPGLRVLIGPT
jgi:hypothetical protein